MKPNEPSTHEIILTSFAGLGYALSARALLLLSLLGGFVLAVMAMNSQTPASLEVMIAYCALIVLPIVYLEINKRRAS